MTPLGEFYRNLGLDPDKITDEPYNITFVFSDKIILTYHAIAEVTPQQYAKAITDAADTYRAHCAERKAAREAETR